VHCLAFVDSWASAGIPRCNLASHAGTTSRTERAKQSAYDLTSARTCSSWSLLRSAPILMAFSTSSTHLGWNGLSWRFGVGSSPFCFLASVGISVACHSKLLVSLGLLIVATATVWWCPFACCFQSAASGDPWLALCT
jgi:hypothetical protein